MRVPQNHNWGHDIPLVLNLVGRFSKGIVKECLLECGDFASRPLPQDSLSHRERLAVIGFDFLVSDGLREFARLIKCARAALAINSGIALHESFTSDAARLFRRCITALCGGCAHARVWRSNAEAELARKVSADIWRRMFA